MSGAGSCYCKRPDAALKAGLKKRRRQLHWQWAIKGQSPDPWQENLLEPEHPSLSTCCKLSSMSSSSQRCCSDGRQKKNRFRPSKLVRSCLNRHFPGRQCALCVAHNGLNAGPGCRNACVPRRAYAQCATHRLHRSTTRVRSGRQAMDGRHGH